MENLCSPVLVEKCDAALLQKKLQPRKEVVSSGEGVQCMRVLQWIKQVFCLCCSEESQLAARTYHKNINQIHKVRSSIPFHILFFSPLQDRSDMKGFCIYPECPRKMDLVGALPVCLGPGTLHTSLPNLGTKTASTVSFLSCHS